VHSEDLLVDDSGDRKAVEAVCESLPQLDVVTTLALIVEAVNTVDGSALVVATEDEEVLRVLDLVCQQEADGLKRLLATVDIVTKEEVVGLWWEAAVLKEAQQIVVLSVDIATNLFMLATVVFEGVAHRRVCMHGVVSRGKPTASI
jgi:hypothetical protein